MQAERTREEAAMPLEEEKAFQTLHTMLRSGYVADSALESADEGVILRHQGGGPDLVLRADGVLQPAPNLPAARVETGHVVHRDLETPVERRGFWVKRLLLLVGLIAFWIFSIILTTGLLEGM